MANFTAQTRKPTEKSNHLKRDGYVPAAVYGGDLPDTLAVKISVKDAGQLLKTVAKGNRMTLDIDGAEHWVLFKNYTVDSVSGRIEHLEFLRLVKGREVKGEALVVLKNRDLVTVAVQQMHDAIPHRAIPSKLVSTVEIDLNGMKEGAMVRVEDLDIAKDPAVTVLLPHDDVVIHLVDLAAKREVAQEIAAAGEAAENAAI